MDYEFHTFGVSKDKQITQEELDMKLKKLSKISKRDKNG